MEIVETPGAVRSVIAAARGAGKRVALVPTMGYLHEGHLRLIDRARAQADFVALSIFVNPLQFGPAEDLDRYPRDLPRDLAAARERGVDLVLAPGADAMYPDGPPRVSVVPDAALAGVLCGATRPGHFAGVLTVVAKLLGIFAPDVAVFGQKDLQQAVLIRRMAIDLDFAAEIDVAPIVREDDGLAMSSRNVYLSADDRIRALALRRGLLRFREAYEAGERAPERLDAAVREVLRNGGVQPEYVALVDAHTLEPARVVQPGTACALAARIGSTRLIDNEIL